MGGFLKIRGGSVLAAICLAGQASADGQLSLYGAPGLLDMPTALQMRDGDLGLTFSGFGRTNRDALSFQAAPWLSTTFRYARLDDYFPDGEALFDRSFDVSIRLLSETDIRPAVALGFQDFVGTGIYGAEYLVASKSSGDVTVTAGLGWGRLGSHGGLGSPFGDRPPVDFGLGGRVNADQWFRGPVSPFGGVSWQATDQLTLLAEYSSDDYSGEPGGLTPNSQINLGASWDFGQGTQLGVGWMYGREVSFRFTQVLNPKHAPYPSGFEAAGPVISQAEVSGQSALVARFREEGLRLMSLDIQGSRAILAIANDRYGAQSQALGRAARIAASHLPDEVAQVTLVLAVERGLPTSAVTFEREDLRALQFANPEAVLARAEIVDAAELDLSRAAPPPEFSWGIAPYVALSLFDPDEPVRADLGVRASARLAFGRGFVASGAVEKRLVGNLDQLRGAPDSALPQVRSDYARYVSEGDPGISHLTVAHYGRPAPSLYSRLTLGLLEDMYGGVSGEILWKPVDQRFALGAELSHVRKRDYDRLFGFQDYEITTGFLTAYYDFGAGYHAELAAGRYLAGDVGATLMLSRKFANGWEVGAYVTRTDASYEEFGEGSFDKGIVLSVPVDWFTGRPTRAKSQTVLRSLGRDGGARLNVDERLYGLVRDSDDQALRDRWGRFWR